MREDCSCPPRRHQRRQIIGNSSIYLSVSTALHLLDVYLCRTVASSLWVYSKAIERHAINLSRHLEPSHALFQTGRHIFDSTIKFYRIRKSLRRLNLRSFANMASRYIQDSRLFRDAKLQGIIYYQLHVTVSLPAHSIQIILMINNFWQKLFKSRNIRMCGRRLTRRPKCVCHR